MASKKKQKLSVDFSSVSFGGQTARVGIKCKRDKIDLAMADELLCGARLAVEMRITGGDDKPLLPNALPHMSGIADCKHLGVTTDEISAGLTFQRKDLDANSLVAFSNGSGTLSIERVGDVDDIEDEEAEAA